MKIHTSCVGDTVFTVARKYGASPIKILEDNGILGNERLTVGEELLILTPTRTYTARGGDSLERICRRFGVKKQTVLAGNPALGGVDSLYPGQVLSLKYDKPHGGMVAANGYVYPECPEEKLIFSLPYLTYVTVSAATTDTRGIRLLFDDRRVLRICKDAGKTVLFRVVGKNTDDGFFSDKERQKNFLEKLAAFAKERGYDGITLGACRMANEAPDAYLDFVLTGRKVFLGMDMLLFTETDGNVPCSAVSDLADGNVLLYEKCPLPEIPSFEEGEGKVIAEYAKTYESSRTFLDISPFGFDTDVPITRDTFYALSYKYNTPISYDEKTKICTLTYPKFSFGKRQDRTVRFDSLHNIKAKLDLADEFGYMGISFDIMRTPVPYWMMFTVSFSPVDYAFAVGEDVRG